MEMLVFPLCFVVLMVCVFWLDAKDEVKIMERNRDKWKELCLEESKMRSELKEKVDGLKERCKEYRKDLLDYDKDFGDLWAENERLKNTFNDSPLVEANKHLSKKIKDLQEELKQFGYRYETLKENRDELDQWVDKIREVTDPSDELIEKWAKEREGV